MNFLPKKRPALWLLLLLFASHNTLALEPRPLSAVDSDKLIAETQKSVTKSTAKGQRMSIAWWIPIEFWQVMLAQNANLDQDTQNVMLNTLQDYFVLAVVVADINANAQFDFYDRTKITNSLRVTLKRPDKDERRLAPTTSTGGQVEAVLQGVRPVLSNAMGAMGENFQLFVFEDKIKRVDERRVNPYVEGLLTVELGTKKTKEQVAEFAMPLDSLFVPRICPNGKPAHVSWEFCPWSGKKLDN